MFSRRQSCRGRSQSPVVRIAEEMETEPSKPGALSVRDGGDHRSKKIAPIGMPKAGHWFVPDSPLEGDGFELLVPKRRSPQIQAVRVRFGITMMSATKPDPIDSQDDIVESDAADWSKLPHRGANRQQSIRVNTRLPAECGPSWAP